MHCGSIRVTCERAVEPRPLIQKRPHSYSLSVTCVVQPPQFVPHGFSPRNTTTTPTFCTEKTAPTQNSLHCQFDSVRTQTKVFAGKSKQTISITPIISEEEVFEEKFKKEFPEYIERKKEKYTWKQFYHKRMEKKQKKQEEKMNKLVSKIGKSTAIQRSATSKTKLIDIAGSTSEKKPSKLCPLPSNQARTGTDPKNRQVITTLHGPTKIRRVPPVAITRTFTQQGASTKKTTPLMRKCLQMMRK
ncbi:hypothetical protein CRE_21575 [Caenorhabditis remanei]|uniref:Uncharacterized protein n=1 Tax=Caenorhabditis remanei TaxID=31234 RepID=E3NHL5_CAERE|nr:hypothetical protein CRE_21575 [Caenorhabditis remanei]